MSIPRKQMPATIGFPDYNNKIKLTGTSYTVTSNGYIAGSTADVNQQKATVKISGILLAQGYKHNEDWSSQQGFFAMVSPGDVVTFAHVTIYFIPCK